eukprot:1196201-Prorocentrum_minimum.AAC.11
MDRGNPAPSSTVRSDPFPTAGCHLHPTEEASGAEVNSACVKNTLCSSELHCAAHKSNPTRTLHRRNYLSSVRSCQRFHRENANTSGSGERRRSGKAEGNVSSSVDGREPQNQSKSEEYQRHLQGRAKKGLSPPRCRVSTIGSAYLGENGSPPVVRAHKGGSQTREGSLKMQGILQSLLAKPRIPSGTLPLTDYNISKDQLDCESLQY